MKENEFKEYVWQKGRELFREMPWRDDTRPYYILVSELMLQQTQVDRVVPKFKEFIRRFPNEKALSEAPLSEVLQLWNGLGYNRRAKYLHDAAKKIVHDFDGIFPEEYADLLGLPGVGPGTAGAVSVYAFNQPRAFIETNVRTVYFHHFFDDKNEVADQQLMPLIERTLDTEHPREFYWALMDYGSWLKKNGAGKVSKSAHYKKQSRLQGSVREVRGWIVRELASGDMTREALETRLAADHRFSRALASLLKDGLVTETGLVLHLTK